MKQWGNGMGQMGQCSNAMPQSLNAIEPIA